VSRGTVLQTRLDATTAARVRLAASQADSTVSEWIAAALRRELARAGAADALAPRTYELLTTVGYMLRRLMIDALGQEATDLAIRDANDQAGGEAQGELRRALELP
jgi:hypothetical protein